MNTFASLELNRRPLSAKTFITCQRFTAAFRGGSKYGPMSVIGFAQSGHFLGVSLASFAKLFLQSKHAQCVYIPLTFLSRLRPLRRSASVSGLPGRSRSKIL